MSGHLKSVIRVGYWLALAVLVVDACFVFTSLRTIASNNSQVDHARKVLAEIRRSLLALANAETGQRGYLLTERPEYLAPFDAAKVLLAESLGRLESYSAEDPVQAPRFRELERLSREKMEELQETIALNQAQDRAGALRVVISGRGKAVMDQARDVVAAMDSEEKGRLDERIEANRSAINLSITLFTLTTSAGLLLILAVSTLNKREQATREKAAEEILRSEAWLSTTVSSIGDALIATDEKGHVRFLNPVAEALTGWSAKEAAGRPMADVFRIINETTRRPAENPVAKVIEQGVIVGLANHTLLIAKDGTEIPIDDSAAPIKDANGAVTGVVLVFRDITERKLQEDAITEKKRLAEFGRDVGIILSESHSLGDLLDRCARETVKHLDAAFARIWLVDETGQTLELRASAGMYTRRDGAHGRVPIGEYKIGRIALERRPHLTNNVIGDPGVSEQDWAVREGMVAFAGYPLIVEDKLLGVWALFARHELSDVTLRAMDSVARGIALGIERLKTGEALVENEAWLSTTLSSIGDALIATDDQGRVRFMNPIAQHLTGWTQAESSGKPMGEIFELVNEKTREPVDSPVQRVIRDRRVVGLANHTLLIGKDGTTTPIEDSAAPITNDRGDLLGVVMVFRDVTDQRRQETSLRASEERFRQMAESIPHLAWIARSDGHIFWYNQRWYGYTGTTPDQMEGWGWQSVHDPETLPDVLERWKASIDTGEPFDMVFPLKGADGEFRPFLTRVMPLKDEEGWVVQWFGTNTDISKERQAETALRESEWRFRELADAMPQIVWTARPDGILDYFNQRWFEFSGISPDAPGDTSLQPFLHPDDLSRCLEVWGESIRTGSPYQIEFRLFDRKTDRHCWHLVRALATRDDTGRIVKWYGTCTDIEDQKQVEEALRVAKDEAEEANRAKDQFLAVLSHELRTPLNPILLATTSMLEKNARPEEFRPNLEMIRQYVNLQARLIDDLLDVMRIVRGKMPLHWDVADVHHLIRQAIDICRSDVLSKGHKIALELSATHVDINTDPARLQQVFWNLIKNAVKFTPSEGKLTIRTSNIADPSGKGTRLVIEFQDTGIGIEPEILPRLFDHFQQGETTITRRFGGLGLGLAISKGIVEGHGGSITAESAGKNQGTTFRIELKALPEPHRPAATSQRSDDDATLPRNPCRLLVVEDEQATRRLMGRLLEGLGHKVTIADTLETAMKAVDVENFDLIISDIGLPDGSGLELMRRVVQRRGPIPAIALTGYGMEEDIQRSRDAGFTAHMTKPIDFMKLEAMIRQILKASNSKPPVNAN